MLRVLRKGGACLCMIKMDSEPLMSSPVQPWSVFKMPICFLPSIFPLTIFLSVIFYFLTCASYLCKHLYCLCHSCLTYIYINFIYFLFCLFRMHGNVKYVAVDQGGGLVRNHHSVIEAYFSNYLNLLMQSNSFGRILLGRGDF